MNIETKLISSDETSNGAIWICRLLVLLGVAASNQDARQAILAGDVSLDGGETTVTDVKQVVQLPTDVIVRVDGRLYQYLTQLKEAVSATNRHDTDLQ